MNRRAYQLGLRPYKIEAACGCRLWRSGS